MNKEIGTSGGKNPLQVSPHLPVLAARTIDVLAPGDNRWLSHTLQVYTIPWV